MTQIHVPVSVGELVDKITILEIKAHHIQDLIKLQHVRKELAQLQQIYHSLHMDLASYKHELIAINQSIWYNEDNARQLCAKTQLLEIAQVALATYQLNMERARIKLIINQTSQSDIVEAKSYLKDMG
jgi:hypothetical protein